MADVKIIASGDDADDDDDNTRIFSRKLKL